MESSRRNLYSILIAVVSFLLVIGAMLTALAETGFSPPSSETATDTAIPISTFTHTAQAVTLFPDQSTPTSENFSTQSTPTKTTKTPTISLTSMTNTPTKMISTLTATNTGIPGCTIPTGWTTYKVKSGDTLFSIAVRYQTNVSTLQAGNCMGGSTRIITGDTIWVPNNPTVTPSKTPKPEEPEIDCYSMALSHIGNGSDPTASPAKSDGCTTGKYVEGEEITLTAAPAAGWTVASWTGSNNDASTSNTNTLTMPASNHTASVTYLAPTCYSLILSISGTGADLTADPTNSPGCTAGLYVAGETITLTAAPAAGWEVESWTGTTNNSSTSTVNSVTMPASNHAASVIYRAICYTLTLTHTGTGNDPTASPLNSANCPVGSFIANEMITLTASGGSVVGWTGTDNDGSTETTNTLTMVANNHSVSVEYTP